MSTHPTPHATQLRKLDSALKFLKAIYQGDPKHARAIFQLESALRSLSARYENRVERGRKNSAFAERDQEWQIAVIGFHASVMRDGSVPPRRKNGAIYTKLVEHQAKLNRKVVTIQRMRKFLRDNAPLPASKGNGLT